MRILAISVLFVSAVAFGVNPPTAKPTFAKDVQPVLKKYCLNCHTGPYSPDKIDLSKIKTEADAKKNLAMLKKSIHEVEEAKMPPKGSPKPTKAQIKALSTWVKGLK